MTNTNSKRNRTDGRYTFSGNLDRLCKCGRRFGAHLAEAPYPFVDDDGDPAQDGLAPGPECLKFRPAK